MNLMSSEKKPYTWILWLTIALCGIVYVSQDWSPSSYGVLLRQIGQAGEGLVFGEPRPVRSDEWAVVTPLTQATVHNGFERFNNTSLYKEDLRINYGLPILDWGLLFKPTFWGYLFLDPARAFSLHWFATLALFITGHFLLFARLGLTRPVSLLLSVGLYFTPFTQFWWNEKGPIMALFPWVVLSLLAPWHWALRLMALYWIGASWLITNFYPPLFLSLAFVGAVMVLSFGRDWFRLPRFLALAAVSLAAGLTAALYLKDYLLATARTVYPGGRSVGGGSVPWSEWFAPLFPFSTFDWQYESLRGANICEVGVVGASFLLVAICCLKYDRVRSLMTRESGQRAPFLLMCGGLLLMAAWMVLPLPAWAGAPLLWNHVQPERMEYAFGLLLMLFVAWLSEKAGLVLNVRRLGIYLCAVLLGWFALKGWDALSARSTDVLLSRLSDLVVIPALLLALIATRRWRWKASTAVLAASALSGAIVLFAFNPIQSSKVIFAGPNEQTRSQLMAERTEGGSGPVAMNLPGATVNGLGFPSVTHVTPVPALAFWRERYPDMPEAEFTATFNRYSHIRLRADISAPRSDHPDAVDIPLADFWPDRAFVPTHASRAPVPPQWLAQGQTFSARFSAPRAGTLTQLGVMIGTGNGAADGQLRLQVCEAQHCTEGSAPLTTAADNAFITVPLEKHIVVDKDAELSIVLTAHGGQHGVALWLHQDENSERSARSAPFAPRWRLHYAPPSS